MFVRTFWYLQFLSLTCNYFQVLLVVSSCFVPSPIHMLAVFSDDEFSCSFPRCWAVLIVAFFLLYVARGNQVQAMVGERADAETIARLRAEYGWTIHFPPVPHYVGGVVAGRSGQLLYHPATDLRDLIDGSGHATAGERGNAFATVTGV